MTNISDSITATSNKVCTNTFKQPFTYNCTYQIMDSVFNYIQCTARNKRLLPCTRVQSANIQRLIQFWYFWQDKQHFNVPLQINLLPSLQSACFHLLQNWFSFLFVDFPKVNGVLLPIVTHTDDTSLKISHEIFTKGVCMNMLK